MFPSCKKQILQKISFIVWLFAFIFMAWQVPRNEEDLKWVQRCLLICFNAFSDSRLKKWDLSITPNGFLRFKKIYTGGKQEYFSFNLNRFQDLEYMGDEMEGTLILKTKADDIIVQTHNDPGGNIDSMASSLKISVSNVAPLQLDSLRNKLLMLRL